MKCRQELLIVIGTIVLFVCTSCGLSPVQKQIQQGKAMVTSLSAEADKAIAAGDYYVAATILLTLMGNPGVEAKVNSISSHVPGGLLYQGMPPYYMSFTSRDTIYLPNWPQNANELLGISLDSKRGMVDEAYNNVASFIIDFETGSLTRYNSRNPRPSPDMRWTVSTESWSGAVAVNIATGKTVPLCSPTSSPYRWSRDSSKLVAIDGNKQVVYIMDVASGSCNQVKLPGLDWDTEVLLSPNNQQLVIIVAGSYSAVKNGQLLVANVDGTGIKKIADMPFSGREPRSTALLSPDGSAVYVEGYVISTRTGNSARTLNKAIAWLDAPPPSNVSRDVQVIVDPQQGPRGTRFSFRLSNGPPGQEISWFVSPTIEKEKVLAYKAVSLDSSGSLTDEQRQFGFDTGLTTDAGTYYVLIYIKSKRIGMAPFKVVEP